MSYLPCTMVAGDIGHLPKPIHQRAILAKETTVREIVVFQPGKGAGVVTWGVGP